MTNVEKEKIKRDVVQCLAGANEVRRIVVFGSFLQSEAPHDIDVAVFQESDGKYLELSMKYRRMLRSVMDKIAVDVVPVRPFPERTTFLTEIEKGEVIYEK